MSHNVESDSKKTQPEREQTDESLRAERKNTDRATAERRARVEQSADMLVERARDQADAVLGAARGRADSKLHPTEPGGMASDALVRSRALEDEILSGERIAADEALRREREEQTRTLAVLLPLERGVTDRLLLTERARSDRALANRDDFLGMVSHDLRSLLSGIVLNAGALSDEASDSDEGRRTIASMARIQSYVARMNRLIGDLVDVVSIEAGRLAVQVGPCSATALLTEAIDAFAAAAAEKGVGLEGETSERDLSVHCDRERMLQVLANLITNALKFTARGGKITIRGEPSGTELQVSVRDTGVGIPSDMLEAVFERFWQVGKNDQRGLGLGLYISRCIVTAHGGRIWVESKVGEGSVFRFTVPRASSELAHVGPQTAAPAATARRTKS